MQDTLPALDEMSLRRLEIEVADLTARRDIQDAVFRYMRGQDRLLPEVQLSAFHADAHIDCGLFAGPPAKYVEFAQAFLGELASSHHLIGQMHINVSGDSADGEIYFTAWHRVTEDGVEKDLTVAGRYVDLYALKHGEWRIQRRCELIDWARTDPASDSFLRNNAAELKAGGRGARDFSVTRDWNGIPS